MWPRLTSWVLKIITAMKTAATIKGFEVMRMIRRGHCLTCKPHVKSEVRSGQQARASANLGLAFALFSLQELRKDFPKQSKVFRESALSRF